MTDLVFTVEMSLFSFVFSCTVQICSMFLVSRLLLCIEFNDVIVCNPVSCFSSPCIWSSVVSVDFTAITYSIQWWMNDVLVPLPSNGQHLSYGDYLEGNPAETCKLRVASRIRVATFCDAGIRGLSRKCSKTYQGLFQSSDTYFQGPYKECLSRLSGNQ